MNKINKIAALLYSLSSSELKPTLLDSSAEREESAELEERWSARKEEGNYQYYIILADRILALAGEEPNA